MKIDKFLPLLWIGIFLGSAGLVGQFFAQVPEYVKSPLIVAGILCVVIGTQTSKPIDVSVLPPSDRKRTIKLLILLVSILSGSIISFFALGHTLPQISVAVRAGSGVAAFVTGSAIVLWAHFRSNSKSNLIIKKRSWVIGGLCVGLVASLVFSYLDRYGNECRRIEYEIGIANKELNEAPPGLNRVEKLLQKLRAIDTRRAPSDVRRTLNDYIETMELALTEFRATGRFGIVDKEVAARQKAFAETIKQYE